MTERRWERRRSPSIRNWTAIGFPVLAVVTAVLVGAATIIALQAAPAGNLPPPSYELSGTAAPEPTGETVPTPTRLMVGVDDSGAWRASAGSCPGTLATIEFTRDGGKTWLPSDAPAALGVTSILALERGDDGRVRAVGQPGDTCAPRLFQSVARADDWETADGVESQWYVVPGAPTSVNSPGGVRATPCSVVVAVDSALDQRAGVLCNDERFFRTRDGGLTWDGGLVIPGSRSFGAHVDGYLVAAVGRSACAGVQLEVVYEWSAPRDGAAAGCRVTDAPTDDVLISVAGDAVWLSTGDETAVTRDRGLTWN